ncbi:hypothetical protein NT04LM_3768, partial [Listeria monocytogenes FSL F2-208]
MCDDLSPWSKDGKHRNEFGFPNQFLFVLHEFLLARVLFLLVLF